MTDTPIATLHATAIRRAFAYGAVFGLGALVILVAFWQPPAIGWQIFLIAFGAATLVVAERMRRATRVPLILSEGALSDGSGLELTTLDNIASVDRGAFAFKPSNGFILRLHRPVASGWAPGMWWRYGRRIGVGGVTAQGAGKFMAEQIALRIKSDS
ncbi:MAG: hypothetical protein AAGL89_08930 [Pseudomonadota bacterium]